MKRPEYSEWETDAEGRRFRRMGNCIEYEPEVSVNGMMVPVSQADSVRRQMRESEERAERKRAEAEAKQHKMKDCPFNRGIMQKCRTSCGFYSEDGCMKNPDTEGKHCPISNHICNENCMLYEDGCSIVKKWRD